MHRSLAKQGKFHCIPVLPLAFNIWLFKKFPPQNVKAPMSPPDPTTAIHPGDLATLDSFLYERGHVRSVGGLLALHLHDGFISGVYCTVVK
jgi:hypothetical protein